MDDVALVGVGHRAGQLLDQRGGLAVRLRRADEPLVQRAALHELQAEVRLAAQLVDLVDLHDVGVLELGDGLGLQSEAGQVVLAGVVARQDHLEGDDAVEADCRAL